MPISITNWIPARPQRHRWLVLIVAIALAGCQSSGPDFDPAAEKAAIRAVLADQVAAWNAGDLERFMAGYAQTDSLRFASGGSVRHGWATTLERYRKSYPDRAAMGTLAFEQLDIRVLAPEWAMVFGRWQLDRADDAPSGLFTLMFQRRAEGWRIVHDHTSSAS